jgi:HK97 family phage portal protein
MMFSALLLRGLAVAEYVYDARGNITDIIPLHPDYAEPFRAPDGTIAYRDTYGGQRRILLADEVLAVRGFTVDGVTPLSPIKAAAMTLGVGAALDAFSGKYFENGTVIGGVLEGPAAMSDKAYQRLQDWTERHQGVGRAHKPAILEEGFKWTTASVSAEDAQLIEAKRYSLSDIARIYHFPLYKLAEMTQAKFANVEQQAIDYVGDTLQPVATRFEMAVNASLLSEEEQKTLYTKINLRGLLRGDSKQRGEFYQLMWSMGAYSPNRILELEDENPVEGGDARYVPVNYAEVGAEEQPDEEDTPATDGPNLEPFARDIAQRLLTAECKGVRKVLAAKAGEEGLADFYNAHHKMVQRALAPFGADVAQAYYLDVLNRVAQGVTLHDVGQWEQSRVQPDTNFILREARHAAAN